MRPCDILEFPLVLVDGGCLEEVFVEEATAIVFPVIN